MGRISNQRVVVIHHFFSFSTTYMGSTPVGPTSDTDSMKQRKNVEKAILLHSSANGPEQWFIDLLHLAGRGCDGVIVIP